MEIAPRISIADQVRFGKPVIQGTRVPVDLVLGKLAGGMTYDEVMAEYDLVKEDNPRRAELRRQTGRRGRNPSHGTASIINLRMTDFEEK